MNGTFGRAGLIFALFLIGLFMSTSARADFDVSSDFSATSNPNGVWTYGWSHTLGSSFIADAINRSDSGIDFWQGSVGTNEPPKSFPTISRNSSANPVAYTTIAYAPHQFSLHPGPNGEYSVARFTVPSSGIYALDSAFVGIDLGPAAPTSTDVHVLINGVSIFDAGVNGYGNTQPFSATKQLQTGDTIDFAVGYGSNGTYGNDSTGLSAHLSLIPEPSQLALCGVFVIGALQRRRNL